MHDLSKLPNIGKVNAEKLTQAGVTTSEQLCALGSREAFRRMYSSVDPDACLNTLYALEGAVRGIRWHGLPEDVKRELKVYFTQLRE